MSDDSLSSHLHEMDLSPDPEFTAQANGTAEMYDEASADHEGFWAAQAREREGLEASDDFSPAELAARPGPQLGDEGFFDLENTPAMPSAALPLEADVPEGSDLEPVPEDAPLPTDVTVSAGAAGSTVAGTVRSVADAAVADVLVVPATGPDGPGLYAVEASAAEVSTPVSFDLTRPIADVTFRDAPAVPLDDAGGAAAECGLGAIAEGASRKEQVFCIRRRGAIVLLLPQCRHI